MEGKHTNSSKLKSVKEQAMRSHILTSRKELLEELQSKSLIDLIRDDQFISTLEKFKTRGYIKIPELVKIVKTSRAAIYQMQSNTELPRYVNRAGFVSLLLEHLKNLVNRS